MAEQQRSREGSGRFFRHGALLTRRIYLIIALFAAIILCLLMLDRFQAYILDATRAYVAGEGKWSKGQKDAAYHLSRYAATMDSTHYRLYRKGLAASLGDRQARLALQATPPQIGKARQGLLAGGNHPRDIDNMISLFIHFGDIEEMHQAIAIWTEGDQMIDELQRLGDLLHKEITSKKPNPDRITAALNRVDDVNRRLSELENRFSATLGHAARKMNRLTGIIMSAATLLLLIIAIILSRRIVQRMSATEAELLASESRFRHVVESNLVGIIFWEREGMITDANDAFLHMLGHTREALQKGMLDWKKMTPDGFRAGSERAMRQIDQDGRCTPYEKEFLHRDGHPVPVYIASARFNGPETGGISFVLDISERKQAEQKQRVATSVFASVHEGIMVTDRKGNIRAVNPSFTAITGYSADEALGKNPSFLSCGRHDRPFYRDMWQQLLSEGSWKGDIWNQRKNGEIYQEWLTISAIRDSKGEISEYVGVFSDITEQRRLEEQLRQSQKMEAIGTLVGGIAHDFNNTLAAVEGNLFLAKQNSDNPELNARLEKIERLSSHSAGMVRQLLAFARKDVARKKPLLLNELLHRQMSLTDTIIPEHITLDMQLCDEPLTVQADSSQLQQVLLNLLNNARDAVGENKAPRIEIVLEAIDAAGTLPLEQPLPDNSRLAHIIIRDNGAGMDREELEHIFEPFFTTKEVGKGTGLGLSMAYGTMQSHHGAIVAESSPGHGTAMHLYLPLIEGVSRAEPAGKVELVSAGQPSSAMILLVDDNPGLRQVTAESLQSLGYRVMTAENGSDALEHFTAHQQEIGLLITDVVMPAMGGFQLAGRIRAISPVIPIIFITGYDPEHSPIPESIAEHSTILSKPFPIETLTALIRQLLQKTAKR